MEGVRNYFIECFQ